MAHNPYSTQRRDPEALALEGHVLATPGVQSQEPYIPSTERLPQAQEQLYQTEREQLGPERALGLDRRRSAFDQLEDYLGMNIQNLPEDSYKGEILTHLLSERKTKLQTEATTEAARIKAGELPSSAEQLKDRELAKVTREDKLGGAVSKVDPGFYNRPTKGDRYGSATQESVIESAAPYIEGEQEFHIDASGRAVAGPAPPPTQDAAEQDPLQRFMAYLRGLLGGPEGQEGAPQGQAQTQAPQPQQQGQQEEPQIGDTKPFPNGRIGVWNGKGWWYEPQAVQ